MKEKEKKHLIGENKIEKTNFAQNLTTTKYLEHVSKNVLINIDKKYNIIYKFYNKNYKYSLPFIRNESLIQKNLFAKMVIQNNLINIKLELILYCLWHKNEAKVLGNESDSGAFGMKNV